MTCRTRIWWKLQKQIIYVFKFVFKIAHAAGVTAAKCCTLPIQRCAYVYFPGALIRWSYCCLVCFLCVCVYIKFAPWMNLQFEKHFCYFWMSTAWTFFGIYCIFFAVGGKSNWARNSVLSGPITVMYLGFFRSAHATDWCPCRSLNPSLYFCVAATAWLQFRPYGVNEHLKFCFEGTRCSAINRPATGSPTQVPRP